MTSTRRRDADTIVTTPDSGKVSGAVLTGWGREFSKLGGAKFWLIQAGTVTGFTREAIPTAVAMFTEAQEQGLERIIAILTDSGVRMGASTVAMALAVARTKVQIKIFSTEREAEEFLRKERS